jgi:hypothetical protein
MSVIRTSPAQLIYGMVYEDISHYSDIGVRQYNHFLLMNMRRFSWVEPQSITNYWYGKGKGNGRYFRITSDTAVVPSFYRLATALWPLCSAMSYISYN